MIDKVLINDVDVTQYRLKWKCENVWSDAVDSLEIDFRFELKNVINLENGLNIKLYRGFENATEEFVFSGDIIKISDEFPIIKLTCYNRLFDAIKNSRTKSWDLNIDEESGIGSEIFKDLCDNSNLNYSPVKGNLTNGSIHFTGDSINLKLEKFVQENEDDYQKMQELAQLYNFMIGYDYEEDKVIFKPKEFTIYPKNIIVGVDVPKQLKIKENISQMINKVKILGATGYDKVIETFSGPATFFKLNKTPEDTEVTVNSVLQTRGNKDVGTLGVDFDYYVDVENQTLVFASDKTNVWIRYGAQVPLPIILSNFSSIEKYGGPHRIPFYKIFNFPDIKDIKDAEFRGRTIINRFSQPFSSCREVPISDNTIRENGFIQPGTVLRIIDNFNNKDLNLFVTSITKSFPHVNDIISAGDDILRTEEWQVNTLKDINKIFSSLNKNQDILYHVVQSNKEVKAEKRYFEVRKKVDSSDWFTTVLVQGEDKYEEYVYDEKFFSPPKSVEVSGSTSPTAVNGIYTQKEIFNDKLAFNKGVYWLWYDDTDGYWKITNELGAGTVYFKRLDYNFYGLVIENDNTILWQNPTRERPTGDIVLDFTYSQATNYCNNLTTGGLTWEMATRPDWENLFNFIIDTYGINENFGTLLNETFGLINVDNDTYWTSTEIGPDDVYRAKLSDGSFFEFPKSMTTGTNVIAVSRNVSGFTTSYIGAFENDTGTGTLVIEGEITEFNSDFGVVWDTIENKIYIPPGKTLYTKEIELNTDRKSVVVDLTIFSKNINFLDIEITNNDLDWYNVENLKTEIFFKNPTSKIRLKMKNREDLFYPNAGFITEWTVSGDTAGRTITLPFRSTGTYNCIIDWGDGSAPSTVTAWNSANRTHTYDNPGTYLVEIKGTCTAWFFNNTGDKNKITDIIHWGTEENFDGFNDLRHAFTGCVNIKSLGIGKILKYGSGTIFQETFAICTKIKSIPKGLFDNHDQVVNNAFRATFAYCYELETVPSGIFDVHTLAAVDSFRTCFLSCRNLKELPVGLFRFNTAVSTRGFQDTFNDCTRLKLNKYIFYLEGEQNTRFFNKVSNFVDTFLRMSFNGEPGIAPDLWNCDFGSQTPNTSGCFFGPGNRPGSLTNFADIPSAWRNL